MERELLTVVRLIQILDEVTQNHCRAAYNELSQFCNNVEPARYTLTIGKDPDVGRNDGIRGRHQPSPK